MSTRVFRSQCRSRMYLDGTTASVSGTAATRATYWEGVVSQNTTDANGNTETAGSTWAMVSTDGGATWTRTFTNMLGEVYLVQQSGPGTSAVPGEDQSYADAVTTYDGNDRVIEQMDFDGTATHTIR